MKTTFKTSRIDLNRLFECNRVSAEIWNTSLELAKNHHLETGEWITKSELQRQTKKLFPLHSQSVQSVVHRYIWNRDSAHKAREKGYNTRYPHRTKKYYPTRWVQEAFTIFPNGKIELSLGIPFASWTTPDIMYFRSVPSPRQPIKSRMLQ